MIAAALICATGLITGFLLIWRVPTSPQPTAGTAPSLSVIIPARNEEHNLPRLLRSIADASGSREVIVVDDDSTDQTAETAAKFGCRVLPSAPKPGGWTGKSWACYQGAQAATGELFLFLDADTYFLPSGLNRILAFWSSGNDPKLVVSLLPYHAMDRAYEQLSLFFNLLMAAGAGGFGPLAAPRLFGQSLLISKELYIEADGHQSVRGVVLENLRWADQLHHHRARIACLGGHGILHMRMFPDGLRQMSESWGKAFLQGAVDSGAAVVLCAVLWISALWSIALLLVGTSGHSFWDFLAYMVLALQIFWLVRQLGNYSLLSCLLFPLPLAYYCGVFGQAAARRALGRKVVWRGREV